MAVWFKRFCFGCALVVLHSAHTQVFASGSALAGADIEAIQRACEALVLDYASFRDGERGEALAELFSVDGTLVVNGQQYAGRQALLARFASPSKQMVRHMMSNIRITVESDSTASGISYALIFVGETPSKFPTAPVEVSGFAAMGEYHDVFKRTANGWRIAARRFVPIFLPKQP